MTRKRRAKGLPDNVELCDPKPPGPQTQDSGGTPEPPPPPPPPSGGGSGVGGG